MEKTNLLEMICHNTSGRYLHQTLSEINKTILDLDRGKKAMLESSVYALQEGEALLDKLNQLWIQSSLNPCTDFKKKSICLAIEQVCCMYNRISFEVHITIQFDKIKNSTAIF